MSARYTLTLTLIEDAHFGSGTGTADTDAFIERDARGLPVIRASHIKGVLLDHANQWRDLKQCEQSQIDRLFGKSAGRRGDLVLSSLYAQTAETPDCPVWTATAREPGSRRPQDDTLRVIEHCPAGMSFRGQLELADPDLADLLERLVRRTDRLGGQRNRGNGLVTCRLDKATPAAVPVQGRPEGERPRLRLLLEAVEPLLLPNSGHPGNLLATEAFIRGQVLQGALVQYALGCHLHELADRWLAGAVAVGDALPLPDAEDDCDPIRAEVLPIPLSLCTPKPKGQETARPWWAKAGAQRDHVKAGHSGNSVDGLADENRKAKPAAAAGEPEQDKPAGGEKVKRPGARQFLYRSRTGAAWLRYEPRIDVRMRVNVPLRAANGDDPGLFSHEEIAEGTRFVSDLDFTDADTAAMFIQACGGLFEGGGWLRVGREGRPVRVAAAAWLAPSAPAVPGDRWRLTLTADTILRNEHLAFVTRPDLKSLLGALGKTIADYPGADQWQFNARYCESVPVHGFNAVTGLRRAPALALRRGSDFLISGAGSAELARDLAALPALGERTQEGYGRFVIGFAPFGSDPDRSDGSTAAIDNPEEVLLGIARAWKDRLETHALPSRSQLGWLRSLAEGGMPSAEILERIDAAAAKLGGKRWESFAKVLSPVIRTELARPPLRDDPHGQRRCLVALVRWLAPRAKESAV